MPCLKKKIIKYGKSNVHSYVCKLDSEYDLGGRRARSDLECKEAQVAGPA